MHAYLKLGVSFKVKFMMHLSGGCKLMYSRTFGGTWVKGLLDSSQPQLPPHADFLVSGDFILCHLPFFMVFSPKMYLYMLES